jgi:tRNA (guanosine-2'-O-)-methyltransferase
MACTEPDWSPAEVIAALAPQVTAARLARLASVAAQRTAYLAAALERFHDRHNVAACVRTADALGLAALDIIPAERPGERPPRDPLLAADERGHDLDGAGSVPTIAFRTDRWVDLVEHSSLEDAAAALRQRGHRIAVTALGAAGGARPLTPDEVPLDRPIAVVFGNERDGVSREALDAADLLVAIPMRGFVASLNVSVAFAMVMGRLRDRLDAEVAAGTRGLATAEQETLVARWLRASVPHAEALLARRGADLGRKG